MEQMYNVSSNPHIRDKMTTSRIMQLVAIALLPTTLFGIWNFGVHALLVVLATVASSVFFEWLYDRLMHKKNTTTDFSAVVTGLLLAMNMPPQMLPARDKRHDPMTRLRTIPLLIPEAPLPHAKYNTSPSIYKPFQTC